MALIKKALISDEIEVYEKRKAEALSKGEKMYVFQNYYSVYINFLKVSYIILLLLLLFIKPLFHQCEYSCVLLFFLFLKGTLMIWLDLEYH